MALKTPVKVEEALGVACMVVHVPTEAEMNVWQIATRRPYARWKAQTQPQLVTTIEEIVVKTRKVWRRSLSAEGERLYERIGTPGKERERSLFRGIGGDEQAQLGRTLDRLIENLRDGADSVVRKW